MALWLLNVVLMQTTTKPKELVAEWILLAEYLAVLIRCRLVAERLALNWLPDVTPTCLALTMIAALHHHS